jgi:chorismate mutase/prephenate dehydratase
MADDMGALREQINTVDEQLLSLLNKRAELALAIGAVKAASGQPVYDPAREDAVFTKLEKANAGPLSTGAIDEIYRTIIAICREMQVRP